MAVKRYKDEFNPSGVTPGKPPVRSKTILNNRGTGPKASRLGEAGPHRTSEEFEKYHSARPVLSIGGKDAVSAADARNGGPGDAIAHPDKVNRVPQPGKHNSGYPNDLRKPYSTVFDGHGTTRIGMDGKASPEAEGPANPTGVKNAVVENPSKRVTSQELGEKYPRQRGSEIVGAAKEVPGGARKALERQMPDGNNPKKRRSNFWGVTE